MTPIFSILGHNVRPSNDASSRFLVHSISYFMYAPRSQSRKLIPAVSTLPAICLSISVCAAKDEFQREADGGKRPWNLALNHRPMKLVRSG